MSIHDGPGIRSTIFLKGCNMRCQWCHNPETFNNKPELEWLSDKCINCLVCVAFCNSGALSVNEGKLLFNKKTCTSCFNCIEACYPEALNKVGREVTAEELYQEIEPDLPFFEESEGGITLSGGEPLLQQSFVLKVLSLFKKMKIHTAIETNLSFSWDKYEQLLPYLDYVMADMKLFNTNQHQYWTGVNNQQIFNNILELDNSGISYELRTPIVPGVNDTFEAIKDMSEFATSLKNLKSYTLIPFHPLGHSKYKNLGIDNPMEEETEIPKNYFEKLVSIKESIIN